MLILTPKEKAKEIFDKYTIATWIKFSEIDNLTTIPNAKECALIAVNEVINSFNINTGNSHQTRLINELNKYWVQVKEEIENGYD